MVCDTCDFSPLAPHPCQHRFPDLVIQEGSPSDQKAGSPSGPLPSRWRLVLFSARQGPHTLQAYSTSLTAPFIPGWATFGLFLSCLCFPHILYLCDNFRSSQFPVEILLTQHLGKEIFVIQFFPLLSPIDFIVH